MDTIISLLGGLALGSGVSYFLTQSIYKNKIKDVNDKADLSLKEAELTAKRKLDEAETKAEKIVARAEQQNEATKQRKIQEARDNFQKLKSTSQSYI